MRYSPLGSLRYGTRSPAIQRLTVRSLTLKRDAAWATVRSWGRADVRAMILGVTQLITLDSSGWFSSAQRLSPCSLRRAIYDTADQKSTNLLYLDNRGQYRALRTGSGIVVEIGVWRGQSVPR